MADTDSSTLGSSLSIDTLSLQIDVDVGKSTAKLKHFTTQLENTTTAVNNSLAPLNSLKSSLSNLTGQSSSSSSAKSVSTASLNESTKAVDSATKATTSAIKRMGVFASVGKIYFLFNYFKRIGTAIGNMVQKGIDFNETLNLWQTSMRGNITEARAFISTMNQAYGISEATLMNAQATFNNMLSSLGDISSEASSTISEALVQMSVDFSSLYNVSLDDAMSKFQAVLAGQVRPIRSVSGYDITESTLNQMLENMGSDKTVRQLSETEKRLLRIYAVFQQMGTTGALGDMSKTLTSNSNQLRIMKSQIEEIGTWLGNIVSYWMQSSGILVTINSYLVVFKEIIKGIAYELGYSEPTYLTGIFETATEATDAVDELQSTLMGFDKFNVLSSSSSDDSSLDIDTTLLEALSSYTSLIDDTVNPAITKANELLEQMGLNFEYTATAGEKVMTFATQAEADAWVATLTSAEQETATIVSHLGGSKIRAIISNIEAVSKVVGTLIAVVAARKIGSAISSLVLKLQNVVGIIEKINISNMSKSLSLVSQGLELSTKEIASLKAAMTGLATTGLSLLIINLSTLMTSWNELSDMERLVSIFGAIASAAMLAAGAIAAMKIAISPIAAKIAIGAGILAMTATMTSYFSQMKSISTYADGGFVNKGQLFVANEAGAEMVGSMDGKTAVANNQQITAGIEQASYRGMARALAESGGNSEVVITIDGSRISGDDLTRALMPSIKAYMRKNGGQL